MLFDLARWAAGWKQLQGEAEYPTRRIAPELASRFRLALDMYEFGERMALAGLRRRYPDATVEQITRMLSDWRRDRPGAPAGDAPGRPSRRFG